MMYSVISGKKTSYAINPKPYLRIFKRRADILMIISCTNNRNKNNANAIEMSSILPTIALANTQE